MINMHEFGKEHKDIIVMCHPLGVWWDVFEYVIPKLEKQYHLVIPAMPGHDEEHPEMDYTSVEDIAEEITQWLKSNGYDKIKCLYGCSMGGGVVTRILAEQKITADCAVIDAGMTPYCLPKVLTYFIAAKDWFIMEIGKHASLKILRGMFNEEKYSEEDLLYVKKVLGSMSSKTIWRAFYSCNNYSMPSPVPQPECPVQYWYGEEEKKLRKNDIAYIRQIFPDTQFVENKGMGHAEYFTLHPKEFCKQLTAFIEQ